MGTKIHAKIVIDSSSTADIEVHATDNTTVECKKEAYKLNGNKVVLPGAGTAGDCVHDSLQKYGLKLDAVTYDPSADTIEMDIKKSFIKIKIILKHDKMTIVVIE